MYHRWYDFILLVINVVFVLGYLTFGGEGWVWAMWLANLGWLRYFTFVLQMVAYSPDFIAHGLKNSTDGKPFDECKALGEMEVEIEVTTFIKAKDKESRDNVEIPVTVKKKTKVSAFPSGKFFEGGTGRLGLANKWGGKEHGFYFVDDRLLLKMGGKGNLLAMADVWVLSPQKRTIVAMLRRVKPTPNDERLVIPPEHWAKFKHHKRFDSNKSAVFYLIEPMVPMIYADELGEAILSVPGRDEEKHTILPVQIRLRDLVGDSPILDLRPEMSQLNVETARAVRLWAGTEINKRDEMIEYLEAENAKLKRLNSPPSGRSGVTEYITTTVQGPDETSQRLG